MNNPKRIKSKRKAWRLERNRVIREPDRNFDPPDDPPDDDEFEDVEFVDDGPDEKNDGPFEDRDCDYWRNLK